MLTMLRVGLLKGEESLRHKITSYLEGEGYLTTISDTIVQFMAQSAHCDIAVIDVGLVDGIDLADALRKSRPQVGIILLASSASTDHRINDAKANADYYLVKPIQLDLLSAHIAALSRRLIQPIKWRLNLMQRHLTAPNGSAKKMSELEMTLLELLARNAGQVVRRPVIASAFGSNWIDYDERHLDQLVSRMRKRWLIQTGEQLPLKTEHGQGYRFCVDIQII